MIDTGTKLVEKQITIREVYEGIEKNGFELAREEWFSYGSACVLGQAAINCNVVSDASQLPLVYEDGKLLGLNDPKNLYDQLNQYEIEPDSPWIFNDGLNHHRQLGIVITGWNDKYEIIEDRDEDGYAYDAHLEYVLPTYDAVRRMAEEVLTPFFDEVLTVYEWAYPDFVRKEN